MGGRSSRRLARIAQRNQRPLPPPTLRGCGGCWIYDHSVVGVEEGDPVAEESWHAARLIPTSGIGGADEQERRATSALLAVMPAVREFGRSILAPLGAPAGTIETFIEVPFEVGSAGCTRTG